ncbi:unnamed protein product, partial [Staurois parvus]
NDGYQQSSPDTDSIGDIFTDHQSPDEQCSPISATCQCPSMPPVIAHQCHIPVPTSAHQFHISVPIRAAFQCQLSVQVSVAFQ